VDGSPIGPCTHARALAAPWWLLIKAGFFEDLAESGLYEHTQVRSRDFAPWFGLRGRGDPIIQAILTNESL
jgi:hypothetical protein